MQETTSTGASAGQGEHDFAALPVGARVGRYEITAILGQGGFGITYRARDEQLHREVAIKEYLPTALAIRQDGTTVLPRSTKVAEDFGWGRERFVAEGRTLASLHNAPGIVRVFDFMELHGTAYIVMELVQGDTLESRLKQKGKLAPGEIDTILWPLLDGLEKVHGTGFVHRDIKPANILLDEDGRPTLIDFGASRAAMAGRTAAMTAIFTPGYAAAEQFTSAKQGPWTDIYGLSATLYHAITGAAPPSAFDRMLDDEYQPLTKLSPPGFKAGLLLGIDAGLAVRASDRPQTIPGWRPLLAQATGGTMDATVALARPDAGGTVVSRPPPAAASTPAPASAAAPAPAPARSRAGLYALVGMLALVILGGGGYFAFVPRDPQAVSVRDMKVEELEKVLEERRRADAEAAEKQRAEEEARQKAEADAAAKRAADEQLAKAEEQRKQAEEQLARLQAELDAQRKAAAEQREFAESQARRAAAEEAQRKAEAEMAALRAAEDEARRRAAIEAEAKKLAEEALAKAAAERAKAEADAKAKAEAEARQKAEADARVRAEAEARAKAQAEKEQAAADAKAKEEAAAKARLEGDKKSAEAAETALRLTTVDRQRLQVALTTLGYNTGGSDGAFGPRSRQAIANWQKSRTEPETGFLTAAQQQALLKDAAPAVAKFDDEQKKLEEDRKKAEEEAKAKATAAQQQVVASAPAPGTSGLPTGTFSGTMSVNNTGGGEDLIRMSVSLVNGRGSGTGGGGRCIPVSMSISVGADGTVSGTMAMCVDRSPGQVSGRYQNGQLFLRASAIGRSANGTLTMGGGGTPQQQVAVQPAASAPRSGAPTDGTYAGSLFLSLDDGVIGANIDITLTLANGRGTGLATDKYCGALPISLAIDPAGRVVGKMKFTRPKQCGTGEDADVSGRVEGANLVLEMTGTIANVSGRFTLARR